MFAGIEWENVNVAGAFVVGAVLATIATIRIFRVVFSERRREASRRAGEIQARSRAARGGGVGSGASGGRGSGDGPVGPGGGI